MSFALYEKSADAFSYVGPLKLTGPNGLLARYLQSKINEDTPFTWQLNPSDLVALHDPTLEGQRHCVLIDMLPESLTEICLYRVTALQGSSDVDESDVVLSSKILHQGPAPINPPTFKKNFVAPPEDPDSRHMLEALHLTGGTLRGNYFWSKPKMDIGAAVCPASREVRCEG